MLTTTTHLTSPKIFQIVLSKRMSKISNLLKCKERRITWFNPPYSNSVATDIWKKCFLLLDKHFPRKHKFYKIFNGSNVQVT